MRLDISLVYPVFALMTMVAFLILIPRNQYKKFFLYGFTVGGVLQPILFTISSIWLKIFKYQNFGSLNLLGQLSVWTPLTFIFMFAIFLYLMPVRKLFFILYLIMWAGINGAVGMVFQSLGLIVFSGPYGMWIDLSIIMLWHFIVAGVYIKSEKIEFKKSFKQGAFNKQRVMRYFISPYPARKSNHILTRNKSRKIKTKVRNK